jgi:hypothetical protein
MKQIEEGKERERKQKNRENKFKYYKETVTNLEGGPMIRAVKDDLAAPRGDLTVVN